VLRGFDPYLGFSHKGRHGKPSLALDLMEEFRPVIADSVVFTLIYNETVTRGDFVFHLGAFTTAHRGSQYTWRSLDF